MKRTEEDKTPFIVPRLQWFAATYFLSTTSCIILKCQRISIQGYGENEKRRTGQSVIHCPYPKLLLLIRTYMHSFKFPTEYNTKRQRISIQGYGEIKRQV